jgi:DNA-binding MarR family transcriptional regulator
MAALVYIRDMIRQLGYGPTLAEIAEHAGYSQRTYGEQIAARLEQEGYITRRRTPDGRAKTRAIKLTPAGKAELARWEST